MPYGSRALAVAAVLFGAAAHATTNKTITVDGNLADWATDEVIAARNSNGGFYVTWDATNIYVAWDKSFPFEWDSDIVHIYFDADNVQGETTSSVTWTGPCAGTGTGFHFLPFSADTVVWYRPQDAQFDKHRVNAANQWVYDGAVGGDSAHNGNDILELRIPRSVIGNAASASMLIWTMNECNSNYIYAIAPNVNPEGQNGRNLDAYLRYPLVAGISPNDRRYFLSDRTWQAPAPAPPSFSPIIDGVKDAGWGSTPSATSPEFRQPNPGAGDTGAPVPPEGIARDVYVTNDAQWLYIGWEAYGDPFQLEVNQQKASAHYGFIVTDTSSYGSSFDPFKSTGTTKVLGYGADVWVQSYVDYSVAAQSFGEFRLYKSDGLTWVTPFTPLVIGTDAAVVFETGAEGWGEVRIPLSSIRSDIRPGDTIAIVHMARHSDQKPGINDMTPYDTQATSDFADNNATILLADTRVITYVVKQGVIDGTHIPDSEPVTGRGRMRTPDTPTVRDNIRLVVRTAPSGVLHSGEVVYSTNNFADSSTASLAFAFASGGADYHEVTLPSFARGTPLRYYFRLRSDRMTTFVYGTDTQSRRTSVEADAKAGAYAETIANAAPSAPASIEISPLVAADADTLTATASGASDPDSGQTVRYRFDWYRNGAFQFTAFDTARSRVPPESTAVGDTWQVFVAAGDGTDTTALETGPVATIPTLVAWDGVLPAEVNAGVVSNGEWIWRDKSGDAAGSSLDFDLREVRLQADATDIFLLARLGGITSVDLPFVAITFDTTLDGAGGLEVGDQTALLVGSGLSTPAARWEAQVILHATSAGNLTAEVDTGQGWRDVPGDTVKTTPAAGLIEARIPRRSLLLEGAATARIAVAAFRNVVGSAAAIDATYDLAAHDAHDAASLATGEQNDPTRSLNATQEDLSDSLLDLWFEVRLGGAGVLANLPPAAPGGIFPANGSTIDSRAPTLAWTLPTDPDAPNDTVVSYLVELAESNPARTAAELLAETVLYRVVSTDTGYTIPAELADSRTYVWRVRARDRAGALGTAATQSFFLDPAIRITVAAPRDDQNLNVYGVLNGDEARETTVEWRWSPASHSRGYQIDSYVIQISTNATFTSVLASDTVDSFPRAYRRSGLARGFTYYARVRGIDTGGVVGAWSPASDGIFISRRRIDGDSTDWASAGGLANNTANLVGVEGIWADTFDDQRTDSGNSTSQDIREFHVTADSFNLYLLIVTQDFVDANTVYQVAVSYDVSSDVRVFEGRNVIAEDSYAPQDAAWEYLVRVRTGDDDVYAVNPFFQYRQVAGGYTENAGQRFVEVAIPLERLGGRARLLGKTVDFVVATFARASSGGVGQVGANNSDIVDAITNVAGNTWNEVSDRVVNYAVRATLDDSGQVTAFSGVSMPSPLPPEKNQNGAPAASNRDFILYNVFTDRFWSGLSTNQPGDQNMTGGDFQGLIDKIEYFNEMGVNGIYLSPSLEFGGGVWGYNQNDIYRVQWSFTDPALGSNNADYTARYGFASLAKLVKEAKRRNIEVFLDWVPGQVYQGRTVTNHPDWFSGKRFGGERVQEGWVEPRQGLADHARFLWSQGIRGFRVDNPKFYDPGDDPCRGLPFFRYWRDYTDLFAPQLYTFGEMPGPGGSGECTIGGYARDGDRLSGMLDFQLFQPIRDWANGGPPTTLRNTIVNVENADYYNGAVGTQIMMAWFGENHDHDRTYHGLLGGDDNDGAKNAAIAANIQIYYIFGAINSHVPIIFYGDEQPLSGKKNWTYPFPGAYTPNTSEFGNTRAKNWNDNQFPWLLQAFRDFYGARAVFKALREGVGLSADGDKRQFKYHDAGSRLSILRFTDDAGDQEKILVALNNSSNDDPGYNVQVEGADGILYEDWIGGGSQTTFTSGTPGWITVAPKAHYAQVWVKGGFGKHTLVVDAGQPGVIVSVDNNSYWTRTTGNDGKCTIPNIVTWNAAAASHTLSWWAPGYALSSRTVLLSPDVTTNTTVALVTDAAAPATPTGLSAVARDRAAVLVWNPNSEADFEAYDVQRALSSGGPWTTIAETFRETFFDNDYDAFLTNGTTYWYRVRAKDRNGNASGWSSPVSVTPTTCTVEFYVDVTGAAPDATYMIAGNHEDIGHWSPIPMTKVAPDLWRFTAEMDPTSRPEYKYVVRDGSGNVTWENNFASNALETNNRLVRIADHAGEGGCKAIFTNRWNVAGDIAPRAPTGVSATGGETSIAAGWQPNPEPDVVRYRIYRSTNAVSFSLRASVDADQNQFVDTQVVGGQTYWYRISAVDWWGSEGAQSESASARLTTADTIPPDTPTNLTLAPAGVTTIRLTWNVVSAGDLAGYDVYRSTDPTVPVVAANRINATRIGPSLAPTFDDTAVTPGVRYYYRVTAVDDSGNVSPASDTARATLVQAVFRIDMGPIAPSAVRVHGDAPTVPSAGASLSPVAGSSSDWAETFGLLAGTPVKFRYRYDKAGATVTERAFKTASGEREWTPPEVARVELLHDWEEDPEGPVRPDGSPGNKTAYLFWSADSSPDLVGYVIDRAVASDTFVRITPSPVAVTSYTDSGLVNGETYYYIVRSVDGGSITLESRAIRVVVVVPENPVFIRFRVEAPRRRREASG